MLNLRKVLFKGYLRAVVQLLRSLIIFSELGQASGGHVDLDVIIKELNDDVPLSEEAHNSEVGDNDGSSDGSVGELGHEGDDPGHWHEAHKSDVVFNPLGSQGLDGHGGSHEEAEEEDAGASFHF